MVVASKDRISSSSLGRSVIGLCAAFGALVGGYVPALWGAGSLSVWVLDQGPGVSPQDLPRIFERGWRGPAKGSGSGLGLAICRSIVEAHGGTIDAESAPTRGTVVRVRALRPGETTT